MKRIKQVFSLLLCIITCTTIFTGCTQESQYTEITLTEVAHSIFYAPMYVAIENGYFKEEGLNITLVNGLGADKTMTAVLSGETDIGFMGSESSIYVYQEGAKDYVVNFAQLTQRAGNFLVTRDLRETFEWENLKGKTVLGGREGGMPEMIFEYILKAKGINPQTDLTIVKNIDFGYTAEAFSSGEGDYTVEFEPAAESLEVAGKGKVVASLGVESGMVPYTAFSAKKSYIKENPEIIQSFTNAIQKGIDYVATHSPREIAEVIQPQFEETELEVIKAIVERYYNQETWKEDTIFQKESFDLLQDILKDSNVLTESVPYEELVTTEFAEAAVQITE